MSFRAVGASYLIRQVAGSERQGGLQVTLYPRSDNSGTIEVKLTDRVTGELHPYPLPEMADVAVDAIKELAAEHSFDLTQLDVKLDRFDFHRVNYMPACYTQAARSAFRAAMESLQGEDNPFGKRRRW
ncbi:MAG: hypothetical protein AAGJ46_15280 [Planctomycetota bacterium]